MIALLLSVAPPITVPVLPAPLAVPTVMAAAESGTPGSGDASDEEPPEVVVTARSDSARRDPLKAVNTKMFAVTQAVDDAVVGPAAHAYDKAIPDPVKSGLRNFRYNLREPVVFANFLLQHKAGKAAETLGRFVINSTLGVAGLFDMAKRRAFKLPRRRNGFANTMGFYGIKPGPYLFLPLVGSTTVRDLTGNLIDHAFLPMSLIQPLRTPAVSVPLRVTTMLDHRAEFDGQLREIRRSEDPYVARRTYYLAKRQAEIDHLRGVDFGTKPKLTIQPQP